MITFARMLAALAIISLTPFSAHAAPIGPDTLLKQEADTSSVPVLSKNVASLQSSYDRTGGNGDHGYYLSKDGGVGVLADMQGPGAIVRIWSANPSSRINIYIDDNPTPVVDMDFPKMFDNSTSPFTAPVSTHASGGSISYLPITYAKHCRVTLDNAPDLYYQVGYVTFPAGTDVRSFSLPLPDADQAALTATNAAWAALTVPASFTDLSASKTVAAGGTVDLGSYKGPGVIGKIRLSAPDASDAELRNLVLRAYFDGHATPDIEAPVADFFGNAYGRKPIATLPLTTATDGSFQASFPMPFAKSARFTLENGLKGATRIGWAVDFTKAAFDASRDGYFHATWSQAMDKARKPFPWVHVAGHRGKFVGVVQTMAGRGGLGFLEGDEQFRVDDQAMQPAQIGTQTVIAPWNGTGTEDCFNCGWYFNAGPVTLPTHGVQVRLDAGKINTFRWFITDAPTFQSSLDAQIEHSGANEFDDSYYSAVSYWYSNGPAVNDFKFPEASSLTPPQAVPVSVTLSHALEGEDLAGKAKASSGGAGGQGMMSFGRGWSNYNQLFWRADQVGATLTLTFTPPATGPVDLVGYFTKAIDYGQFSFTLNGKLLDTTLDAFNAGVIPAGPVDLGVVTLPDGPSTLVVAVTGKNGSATGYFFGLDALCFNPPGTKPVTIPNNPIEQ